MKRSLDEFIMNKYGITRSHSINLIRNGFIKVQNVIIKKRTFYVQKEEDVEIDMPSYSAKILWKNDDICVIFKPCGMCVERTYSTPKWYNVVTECICDQLKINEVFLIHRLDKDTQGLMVVVLNFNMLSKYKEQMNNRMFIKGYKAFYENQNYQLKKLNIFQCNHGRMNFNYDDDKCLCENNDYKNVIIYINETKDKIGLNGDKECITKMKEISGGYDCLLVTGRTHQIRLTMLSLGKPVFGDVLYGNKEDVNNNMQLFSYYLGLYIT